MYRVKIGREIDIGDELVEHQFFADKTACRHGLAPRYTEDKSQWRKHMAKNQLQAQVGKTEPVAHPAQDAVEHGYQGNKGQQHRAHIKGQLQAVTDSQCGGVDDIRRFIVGVYLDVTEVVARFSGLRLHQLGHQQTAGGGHKAGGNQVF